MTSAHILYIPTVFLLGFILGTLISNKNTFTDGELKNSTSLRPVLVSFIVFIGVFVGTHFFEIPRSSRAVTAALNGSPIFDKKPSYSSEEVYARLATFPKEGLELYKEFTYTIDILFPITLLTFLLALTRFATHRHKISKLGRSTLMAAPVLWFSSDIIENALIYDLLANYPTRHDFVAGILGLITTGKFTLLFLSLLGPILIIVFKKKDA